MRDPAQEHSTAALQFLGSVGVDLSSVVQLGGHSRRRTHHNPSGPNVGFAIMKALQERLGQTPRVKLITSAQVDVMDGGWGRVEKGGAGSCGWYCLLLHLAWVPWNTLPCCATHLAIL